MTNEIIMAAIFQYIFGLLRFKHTFEMYEMIYAIHPENRYPIPKAIAILHHILFCVFFSIGIYPAIPNPHKKEAVKNTIAGI